MKKILKFNQFIKEDKGSEEIFKYNHMIDYTLLDNNVSDQDIIDLCEKADRYGVKSVCVMPKYVKIASSYLENSDVLVCTVVDFPDGNNKVISKIEETIRVIEDGADEVDMVLNYNMLKNDGDKNELTKEVSSLVNICHNNLNKKGQKVILKVIVESGILDEKQTELATIICDYANADFIKTSTGKVGIGAEYNKVKVMRDVIDRNNSKMEIKASGDVRTLEQIEKFINMGVSRFGMGFGSVDKLNGLDSKNTEY